MKVRNRRVVALAGAALAAASLALPMIPAQATSTFSFTKRFAGTDRYDTAAEIATTNFANRDEVVLATGENFPDALAGNFLAGALSTPILLTRRDSLPLDTSSALITLKATKVTLLGGTGAISTAVENDLRGRGYTVKRVAGATRYETALEAGRQGIRDNGDAVGTVNGKKTAILASGERFPDALAGGPMAWSAKLPVLLTGPNFLSPEAATGIRDFGIEQVLILGGTSAVSSNVETQVKAMTGVTTVRLDGRDRTETATTVATYAQDNLAFSKSDINLARGDDGGMGADALAGGPHAGREKSPILLANGPTSLDAASMANATFLNANKTTLETGHIFGGTTAVSQAVADAAARAAGQAPPEAGPGNSTPVVKSTVLAEDYFVSTADLTYFYDNNDTFNLNATSLTLSQFEALLNPDDILAVTYDPNASGVSTFTITKDVVHAAGAPGVQAVAKGTDKVANDIQVVWALPTNNSTGTTYDLVRYQIQPTCAGQRDPNSKKVVKAGITANGSFVDENPAGTDPPAGTPAQLYPSGCFEYYLDAKSPTPSTVTQAGANSARIQVPATDTKAPTITSLTDTDAGTKGVVDKDDTHVFRFSETIDAGVASNGSSYRISDGNGTQVDIVCGSTATCTLSSDLDPPSSSNPQPTPVSVLTVKLTAAPVMVSAGTDSLMTYPADIVSLSANFKDSAGNPVSLTGSDTRLD